MSYYDHATHIALQLDRWDMAGQNGTGDARQARDLHRDIHIGRVREIKGCRAKGPGLWGRIGALLNRLRKSPLRHLRSSGNG